MGPKEDCDYLDNDESDLRAKIAGLENENSAIRAENEQLREENARLGEQIQALSAMGNHALHNQPRGRGDLEHESMEKRHW